MTRPRSSARRAIRCGAGTRFIGPFGGVSAATALRAVLEHPERAGDPLAVMVNFCAPIERGEFAVHARCARANRSSQHWQVEFRQGESAGAVLTASIVTALRRESWQHQPARPPALPPFEEARPFDNRRSLSWVARTASGSPQAHRRSVTRCLSRRNRRARCSGSRTRSRAISTSRRCWR